MAWVSHDFECSMCGHEFTEMYQRSQRDEVECPECGSKDLIQLISAPNIAAFSIKSPEEKVASMKQRSRQHTQKEIDKEPERWGAHGIARRTKKVQG